MAHLQPQSAAARAPHHVRLTAMRGFMPDTVWLDGEQVRALWEERFRAQGPGHGFWLYTHIPFCPQICSFCQCSTSLKKSDAQVATYLDWLAGEIDFFAGTAADAEVQFQYVGGGTPNLLDDTQLARLLGTLNDRFRFAPGSRRTFELLPSALRPDTLPLVRGFGFNRLSCGVQSANAETLRAVNRAHAGLEALGAMIESAYGLGFDEVNLDLVHGIGREDAARFLDSVLAVLALRPTTVTIHHVIPTPTNPVYASIDDELAAHAAFVRLHERIGAAVAQRFPDIEWVLRPNSWILVDRRFHRSDDFSLWYYSDNERIHIDMLSVGRFAHSNILGTVCYENLAQAERYDPREARYHTFRKSPAVDAALDVVTDLVGDGRSDLAPIHARYGEAGLRPLMPVLAQLQDAGRVREERDGVWQALAGDGVFIDPFWPLLEAAMQDMTAGWTMPMGRQPDTAVRIGDGAQSLLVFIEKRSPDKRYYREVGRLGVYYRLPPDTAQDDRAPWIETVMAGVLADVQRLVDRVPDISPRAAAAQLRRTRG